MIVGNFEGLPPEMTEQLVMDLDELERIAGVGRKLTVARRKELEIFQEKSQTDAMRIEKARAVAAQKKAMKELGDLSMHEIWAPRDLDDPEVGEFVFGIASPDNRFEIGYHRPIDGLASNTYSPAQIRCFPKEDGEYVFLANVIKVDLRRSTHPDEVYAYPSGFYEQDRQGPKDFAGPIEYDEMRCKIGELTVVNLYPVDELPELVIPATTTPSPLSHISGMPTRTPRS